MFMSDKPIDDDLNTDGLFVCTSNKMVDLLTVIKIWTIARLTFYTDYFYHVVKK